MLAEDKDEWARLVRDAKVHEIIYRELVAGIVKDSSRDAYRAIIARLVDAVIGDGVHGIVVNPAGSGRTTTFT